uniref:Uncharacterized protein n=1 Tax=Meloidogyne enterolobii TaxID=390850 RepID=A0A6V7XH64_MELEN|nr:unnamed protein product [Meloidogyne enterolobii]
MNYHLCPKVFLLIMDKPMVTKILNSINMDILMAIHSAIILNMPFLKKNLLNIKNKDNLQMIQKAKESKKIHDFIKNRFGIY